MILASTPPASVPGRIITLADQFSRELDTMDTASMRRMQESYARVVRGLDNRIREAEAEITDRQSRGETIRPYRLNDLERYRLLLVEAAKQFNDYGKALGAETNANMRAAVQAAEKTAFAQLKTAYPRDTDPAVEYHRLPREAFERLHGALVDDSPLRPIIDSFGAWGANRIEQSLIQSLARGINPRTAFAKIRQDLPFALTRAAMILRTETLRASREGSRAIYQSNNQLVEAWIWHSATDARTCAACWAMHGTEFPLDTPMGTHPNCRCSMLPKTKTWEELGFSGIPETRAEIEPGPRAFKELSEAQQRKILGPGKYDLYRNGEIDLIDLVRAVQSPEWGVTRSVGSKAFALEQAQARQISEKPWQPAGSIEDADRYAALVGAPILPKTLDEAVEGALRQLKDRSPQDFLDDPGLEDRVRKNYRDTRWKDAFDDLDPDVTLKWQNIINSTYADPVYGPWLRQQKDYYVLGRFSGAGEFTGADRNIRGLTALHHPPTPSAVRTFLNDTEYFPRVPLPGDFVTASGAPTLRHELAHELDNKLRGNPNNRLSELVPGFDEIKQDLTGYAGENYSETFCELFSIVNDPKFDPLLFPAWVTEAGDHINGLVGLKRRDHTAEELVTIRTEALGQVQAKTKELRDVVNDLEVRFGLENEVFKKRRAELDRLLDREDDIETLLLTGKRRVIEETSSGQKPEVKMKRTYTKTPVWKKKALGLINTAGGINSEVRARELGSVLREEVETRAMRIRSEELEAARAFREHEQKVFAMSSPSEDDVALWEKLEKEWHEKAYKAKQSRRYAAVSVLKEIRKMGSKKKTKWRDMRQYRGLDDMEKINIREAQEILQDTNEVYPAEWWEKHVEFSQRLPMGTNIVERGYYQPGGSGIYLSSDVDRTADPIKRKRREDSLDSVAIHEMAHRFEEVVPAIRQLEQEFYERRTAGEPLWQLPWDKISHVRKDEFLEPYIGRDYGNRFFEVFSMGAQSLLDRNMDMGMKIQDDEDMYDFILGVLAGV